MSVVSETVQGGNCSKMAVAEILTGIEKETVTRRKEGEGDEKKTKDEDDKAMIEIMTAREAAEETRAESGKARETVNLDAMTTMITKGENEGETKVEIGTMIRAAGEKTMIVITAADIVTETGIATSPGGTKDIVLAKEVIELQDDEFLLPPRNKRRCNRTCYAHLIAL